MGLTPNQEQIESWIRSLCSSEPGFCTIEDIHEQVNLSKQTIHNNIEAVVEARDDIGVKQVGQANVYYLRTNRMDNIWREDTESVTRLFGRTEAEYAELRRAPDESQFDFEVHWYDYKADELESYSPSPKEVGEVTMAWWSEPVAIKITDTEHNE